MNDKEFLELYNKGIKYHYKNHFLLAISNTIVIQLIIFAYTLYFSFSYFFITLVIFIVLVLVLTPVKWEKMTQRYESIIHNSKIDKDKNNNT